MAKNTIFTPGESLELPVPALTLSGDPVVLGQLPGVAQNDRQADGNATVALVGVHDLPVKGIDGGGNVAVAPGDILYLTFADTPKISKKATGVRFGYALEAVTSGATDTIRVSVGY